MSNPIRKNLDTHAGKGYKHLTAAEEDLYSIYLRARNQIERRLSTFLQRKKASFTGPQLVSLFDDLQKIFPEMEEQYCSVYEETLSFMAKQNYGAFLHDMGLEENVVGSMDKTLFENMKQDAFTHIAGATRKMQTDVISNLRQMSAKVMREAALTGMTRAEVSRKLAYENGYGVDSLFQQNGQKGGSFQFIDAAGKQWKTDAYFKMLGRTLLHNNSRECYLSACAKEGSDIVTISVSGDPCDICAKYENRLLSISGKTQGLVTLEQAMSEGLFHPNCTHRMIAVPENVAQEYYDKDGKEKAEKDVAWEKHLAHQELRKEQLDRAQQNRIERRNAEEDDRKKAAHEAHQKHRKEQEQKAYESRLQKWIKEMNDTGIDDQVSNTLADLYTPEKAKLGKPPKIILTNAPEAYYSHYLGKGNDYKGGTIILRRDPNTWEGHPITAVHEFGHWVDYHTRYRHIRYGSRISDCVKAGKEFANAVQADWLVLKGKKRGFLEYYSEQEYFDINKNRLEGGYWAEIKKKLFGEKNTLDLRERKILRQYQDVIGSASKGKYGGGHPKSYYKKEYGHEEAFAQTFSAYIRKDQVFRLEFPKQWEYIENMMKGLK